MSAPASYEIECRCGAAVRGRRAAHSQVVACAVCGKPVFVLPVSPLPAELFGAPEPGQETSSLPAPLRFWLGPIVAAGVALIVAGVVIASIVRSHRPVAAPPRSSPLVHWEAAQSALGAGAYRTAANELAKLGRARQDTPHVPLPESDTAIRRLERQVNLLADLLSESVEEILRHSVGQSDVEWQAIFAERYRHRAVVLDARVFRDSGGRFHVDYQLEAGGLAGEWDLHSLKLLHRLPLQRPQRVFFGFRLAEIARTGRDGWSVRPVPDSGVLFTDDALLSGLSISVDAALAEVLRRQKAWGADE